MTLVLRFDRFRIASASAALAVVAFAFPLHHAHAADLYRPQVNGTQPVSEIERWSGFYFGATLGGARDKGTLASPFGSADLSGSGWVGSVYAGYNWRFGPLVAGVEMDLGTGNYGGSTDVGGVRYDMHMKALASARARVGLLATENFLFYGTGGFALARMKYGIEGGGNAADAFKGYQIGFGGEYKFNPNWSLKLEYIYTDLKENTRAFGGTQTRFDPDFHTVRAGVSFKF